MRFRSIFSRPGFSRDITAPRERRPASSRRRKARPVSRGGGSGAKPDQDTPPQERHPAHFSLQLSAFSLSPQRERRPASRLFLSAVLLIGAFSLQAETGASLPKLRVLTTTLPVFSLCSTVAGDFAGVENLLPPGVEPHDYQISSREIRKIRDAKVILLSGLRLEDWLDRYLAGPEIQAKVVVVSHGFESGAIYGATPLAGSGDRGRALAPNPHFWLDPILAARAAANILAALHAADPARAAVFAANAAKLQRDLAELDASYSRELQPLREKPFVTSHDFFAYPARRYRLRLAGVLEADPEVEPSLRHVVDLGAMIRREKVGVIFVEPRFPSKLADQLCLDFGLVRRDLDPIEIGPLTAGAYLEGMRRNLVSLKEGLGGRKN
jgi:zinc transport system substrate-binding protein